MANLTGKKPSEFSAATKEAMLLSIMPYKSFVGLITQYPHLTSSNPLVVGRRYLILDYQSGDDFTNAGASSNESEVIFTATDNMANNYEHNSVLVHDFDPFIEILHNNIGEYTIERALKSEFRLWLDGLDDFDKVFYSINLLPDAAPNPTDFDAFVGIERGENEVGKFIRLNCIDFLLNKTPIEVRIYK